MKKPLLYDIHSLQGAIFDDFSGWLMPKSYGNPLEEYLAVRNSVGIVDLSHRGRLRLSGKEHVKFLQGMVTNDVGKLEVGKGLYAALLTVKGKIIADMAVYRETESLLLDLEPGLNEKVRELLVKYRLSYKANIEDLTESLSLLSIHGPNSKRVLQKTLGEEIPEINEYGFFRCVINGSEIMIVRINRTGEEGYDIFVPACSEPFDRSTELTAQDRPGRATDGLRTLWELLIENGKEFGLRPIGLDAMETLRIEAGIPKYGVDMDENTIPLEAGLHHAISYEKGCYMGQEVIARIKWRGHVNWCLVGFEIEGENLPLRGDKIIQGEREIGYITSSAFSLTLKKIIALGYIRREFKEPGTKVLVKLSGENKSAEVVKTPFLQNRGL